MDPNDVAWQAENPSGTIVDIKAQEACEICMVGNGQPEWKCTPYEPSSPEPITPTVPVKPDQTLPEINPCDGLSGALDGSCSEPIPITPTVPSVPAPPKPNPGKPPVDPDPITPTFPPVIPPTGPDPVTPPTGPDPVTPPTTPDPVTPTNPPVTSPGPQNPTTVDPVPPVYTEIAVSVDEESNLRFTNLNRERAIKIIQTLFLPRNVDAQPRTFSSYGVSLMHATNTADCPDGSENYYSWASMLHSSDGEGDKDDLVWNGFDSVSSGVAAGVCIPIGEKQRWGIMAHYGETEIDHDISGRYESDNYGAGAYYIAHYDAARMSASLIYAAHDGEEVRRFGRLRGIGIDATGDRDSSSLHLGWTLEKMAAGKPEQEFRPFGAILLSYIDQEAYREKGMPLFTLDYDSRQTWWLNAEAGIKWVRRFLTREQGPWRLESAAALTWLDTIADEDQRFTYSWDRSLAISSKGDLEMGGALSLGLFREPDDPDAWRVSATFNVGYISEQVNNAAMLTLVIPFGY